MVKCPLCDEEVGISVKSLKNAQFYGDVVYVLYPAL